MGALCILPGSIGRKGSAAMVARRPISDKGFSAGESWCDHRGGCMVEVNPEQLSRVLDMIEPRWHAIYL